MKKKYQVFVSSTYHDLVIERNEVIKALLELDCIPCGMEYFPAASEGQWSYIKKLIEECDYYIVLSAGKYGSQDENGISYTQKEYLYAVEKDVPVIGFLYKDISKLQLSKSETDKKLRTKLEEFHLLIKTKLCRFWESPEELGAVVSRSLTQEMKNNPRMGWIKADGKISENAAEEILNLKRENEYLEKKLKLALLKGPEESKNLSQGDDKFEFHVDTYVFCRKENGYWKEELFLERLKVCFSWDEIFMNIASYLFNEKRESSLRSYINNMPKVIEYLTPIINERKIYLKENLSAQNEQLLLLEEFKYKIVEEYFQTIKIQLIALGLLELSKTIAVSGSVISFIKLSLYGEKKLFQLKAVKK